MASSLRSFAAALLFLMLFMATELGTNTIMVAEAKLKPGECEKPSAKYMGPCVSSVGCRKVCYRYEGLPNGYCKGEAPSRKCMCIKPC